MFSHDNRAFCLDSLTSMTIGVCLGSLLSLSVPKTDSSPRSDRGWGCMGSLSSIPNPQSGDPLPQDSPGCDFAAAPVVMRVARNQTPRVGSRIRFCLAVWLHAFLHLSETLILSLLKAGNKNVYPVVWSEDQEMRQANCSSHKLSKYCYYQLPLGSRDPGTLL